MPEKALGLGYAGMASMKGTGSSGSCDSVASITSNHSALSDESYDYLSAEERDVLMYLEETIDSLDADSGLSTDDSERVEETPDSPKNTASKNPYAGETLFLESPGKPIGEKDGMNSYRGSSRIIDVTPKPSYNSLPKNLMIPRAELVKNAPVPADVPTPPAFEKSLTPEKPKRNSLANANEEGKSISEIGLIPPPMLFRDTEPVVRYAVGIRGEVPRLDDVDSTELEGKSRMTLEKHQHFSASLMTSDVMKTKGDHIVAPLEQLSPAPPGSESYNEPLKKMVDSTHAQIPSPVQASLALATDREPIKKMGDPTHAQKEQPGQALPAFKSDADPLMKYVELTHAPIQHPAQTPCGLLDDPEPIKPSRDPSHATVEHIGPVQGPTAGNSEPPKQMVVLKPLWKPTIQVTPALLGTIEAPKEPEATKSPTRKTDYGLQALPVNDEPVEAPVNPKPPTQPPTPVTPTPQFHNREVTQSSRGHAAVQPLSPSVSEHVDKDVDQSNVLLLSQAHREKSVSQETLQNQAGKTVDAFFKFGPPTHPKPLKLPPHIIVKTTYVSHNIEPQQRFRTQSLINVPIPTRSKSTNVKSHIIRDQQTTRQEALEKLKLAQGKTNLQSESSVIPVAVSKKEEIPIPHIDIQKSSNPVKPEDNQNNQKFGLQHKTSVRSNQGKPSVGMWSRQFPAAQEKAVPMSSSPPKSSVVPKSIEIQIPSSSKENLPNYSKVEDDQNSSKSAWQEKGKTISVSPEKVYAEKPSVGMWSRQFPAAQEKAVPMSISPPKSSVVPKSSEIQIPPSSKENVLNHSKVEDDQNSSKSAWQEKGKTISVSPEKVYAEKPSVGMWSRQFPAAQEKAVPISSSPPKSSVVQRSSEIQIPLSSKENLSKQSTVEDDQSSPKSAWQDKVKTFSVSPEKVYAGLRSREFPSRQAEMESSKDNPLKNGVEGNESIPKSRWQDKSSVSTSIPEKVSGSPRPSEIPPSDHSIGRESVGQKIKILSSSQLDLSSGQGFRLHQGSVPGLREITFKSNTLERSGIGLSNVKQDSDDPKPNSGSNSFLKKLSPSNFHSNFSKKNRQQRPVSIGTAGEFIAIQESSAVPAGPSESTKSDNRRSAPFSLFPPKPRPSSLISVKITPKNTADEHREALKKLGLLHE